MTLIINPTTLQVEDVPDFISEVATVAADIARTNDTLVNAEPLRIPFGPSQRFYFNFGLFFTTNATADFKFRLSLPAAAAQWRVRRQTIAPDALSTLVTAYDVANNGTTDLTVLCASGTEGFTGGEGVFVAPNTRGELIVQFGQNTTNAGATTLRAGSYLGYKQF
jgi:hypothetical protein